MIWPHTTVQKPWTKTHKTLHKQTKAQSKEPIINWGNEKSWLSFSGKMKWLCVLQTKPLWGKPCSADVLVIQSAGINLHSTNIFATNKHQEKSPDSKITAVYDCRTCHCLGNLHIQRSRTNSPSALPLGFLSEGKKCIKDIRINAMLLFHLKPVVCLACSQPWNAVVLHWGPDVEFSPGERHTILLQIVPKKPF